MRFASRIIYWTKCFGGVLGTAFHDSLVHVRAAFGSGAVVFDVVKFAFI